MWDQGSGPLEMSRSIEPIWFMPHTFGQQLKPWEIMVKMKNDLTEKNCSFKYNYSEHRYPFNGLNWEWERDPVRNIKFIAPELYKQANHDNFDIQQR